MYNLAARTRDLEIVKRREEVRFDKLSDKSKRNSLRLLVQCELERRNGIRRLLDDAGTGLGVA